MSDLRWKICAASAGRPLLRRDYASFLGEACRVESRRAYESNRKIERGSKYLKTLARETGLEPAASAVTGRRLSNIYNAVSDSFFAKTRLEARFSDSILARVRKFFNAPPQGMRAVPVALKRA